MINLPLEQFQVLFTYLQNKCIGLKTKCLEKLSSLKNLSIKNVLLSFSLMVLYTSTTFKIGYIILGWVGITSFGNHFVLTLLFVLVDRILGCAVCKELQKGLRVVCPKSWQNNLLFRINFPGPLTLAKTGVKRIIVFGPTACALFPVNFDPAYCTPGLLEVHPSREGAIELIQDFDNTVGQIPQTKALSNVDYVISVTPYIRHFDPIHPYIKMPVPIKNYGPLLPANLFPVVYADNTTSQAGRLLRDGFTWVNYPYAIIHG